MNLWAVEIKNLGRFEGEVEKDVVERSVKLFAIGADETLIMIFGIIPLSLLARTGFIWVYLPPEGKAASRVVWRSFFRVWPEFYTKIGWDLIAFTKNDWATAVRFMRFFGFEPFQEKGDVTLYRRIG